MIIIESLLIAGYLSQISIKKYNYMYFSKSYTMMLRGFLTLLVFFRHFSEYVTESNLGTSSYILLTKIIGQLMVGLFLYISGYGLTQSYKKNGKNYITSFNYKHTSKIVFRFWIALLFFLIFNAATKRYYPMSTIVLSFLAWDNIGNSNWYVFATIICYLLFWGSHKLFKADDKEANIVIIIGIIVYTIVILLFKPDYWCSTIFCFPAGVLYSTHKNKIDKLIISNKGWLFQITFFVLAIAFTLVRYNHLILYINSCIFFCLFITTISVYFNNKDNKIIAWIGKNSFGIYLLQRIPMILFSEYIIINNDVIKCLLCLAGVALLLLPYNILCEELEKKLFS